MPASGPFIIDGDEFITDDKGDVFTTTPAVPANTNPATIRRLRVLRTQKREEKAVAQATQESLAEQITTLSQEINDLNTLITNAA
jgi:hypothetical protein